MSTPGRDLPHAVEDVTDWPQRSDPLRPRLGPVEAVGARLERRIKLEQVDGDKAAADSVAGAMDALRVSLTSIRPGAAHSRLTEALLREQLHLDTQERFTHVLLVKSQGGALHELVWITGRCGSAIGSR